MSQPSGSRLSAATSPSTPRKRNARAIEHAGDYDESPSQKRLRQMQAALAEKNESDRITPAQHPAQPEDSEVEHSHPGAFSRSANAGPPLSSPRQVTWPPFPDQSCSPNLKGKTKVESSPTSLASASIFAQDSTSDNEERNDESIRDMIYQLGRIANYVKKLEKDKISAERNCEAKSLKITHQENEIKRLKLAVMERDERLSLWEGNNG